MSELRLKEAEPLCWKWNRQLSSGHMPLGERVRHLRAIALPSLLWGPRVWTPSRGLFDFIGSAEIAGSGG